MTFSPSGEIKKCAWNARHFAEVGPTYIKEIKVETEYSESYIRFDSMGPVLLVMPWNFPFWQVLRQAIPTILAGNTVVLKHASNVPMCAAQIEDFFKQAGFPEGIYQNMYISSSKSEMIMEHKHVRGLNLTGGERAGRVL